MTDAQTYQRVQTALQDLKFLTATESLDALAQQAATQKWTYLTFLDHLTQAELAARREQRVARHIRRARFPFVKTLDQFDFASQPSINEAQVRDLATLRFVAHGENVLLLGPPGVGKTHLAITLGMAAILQGKTVAFYTVADLLDQLSLDAKADRLPARLKSLARPDVLILDEMGYFPIDKRTAQLAVELATSHPDAPKHIVMDSTGLKIYGEGEWKVRQYGYTKRRTWRKLHLSVDEATQEIQAVVLTEARVDDAEAGQQLLTETPGEIEQVSGDGSYDKRKFYAAATERGVKRIVVPPQRNAKIWQHGNSKKEPLPRDENLRRIRQMGRKQWKIEAGYHRRSLAETAVFRFKTIFGSTLSTRTLSRQITEASVKAAALNRMTQLGMPDSYRIS